MVKKFLFIVNPEASRCNLSELESNIRKYFKRDEYFYEILVVSNRESIQIAVEAALERKFNVIVAVGGDGTIASVANLLIKNTEIDFGIIPLGTSNALAKELNIPVDIDGACRLISEKYNLKKIDAMKMEEKYYFNRISVGLSSVAIKETSDDVKKTLGTFSYLWSGIGTLLGFDRKKFKVKINGEEKSYKAADIVVNNAGTILFSNIKVSEDVSLTDGNMEVIIFKSSDFTNYLKSIKDVVQTNWDSEYLEYFENVKEVEIIPEEKLPVQADGDLVGNTPVKIEIVPEALRVIVSEI